MINYPNSALTHKNSLPWPVETGKAQCVTMARLTYVESIGVGVIDMIIP
jgi:hypothetical protein